MTRMVKYRHRLEPRRPKRRFPRSRVPRPLATRKTGYLKTVQKVFTSIQIPIILANSVQTIAFDISTLPNLPELTRLFDQYRITGVKLQMVQTSNTADTTNPGMVFGSSINLDGGAVPASFDALLQRSNTKVTPWCSNGGSLARRTIFLRPRYANEIYRAGVTSATALGDQKSWLDCQFADIPHYGLDFGWNNGVGALNIPANVSITISYYLEFRKVK